ncbi:MAG: class I SAM-dependent methyltransferase [Alphaproteobacteria bacterium]|nr:class I SAM-dependent methyltransferase [Alphaproteobacteria bacterium]
MALQPAYLDYIQTCVDGALGGFAGTRMLELGDQVIKADGIPETTGKEYYRNRGVDHVSFDLNGAHGALAIDLAQPIADPQWRAAFDIVTNSGTTEHVEPLEAQHTCFMNIHDCLKVGGISVHLVPDLDELEQRGRWKNHCNNYYSHRFFETLAELNGYTLVSSEVINGLRCACLRKNADAPFTDDREAVLAGIGRRSGGVVYSGINTHPLISPFASLYRRIAIAASRLGRG